jgi:hypothetical protein
MAAPYHPDKQIPNHYDKENCKSRSRKLWIGELFLLHLYCKCNCVTIVYSPPTRPFGLISRLDLQLYDLYTVIAVVALL